MTIFKKIIDKQIPARVVYEDDQCMAFYDINPQAPVHVVFIPKKEIYSMNEVHSSDAGLLGHMMTKIPEITKKLGINETGYRLVVNTAEDGGQSVFHLHLHILGGRPLSWPPG